MKNDNIILAVCMVVIVFIMLSTVTIYNKGVNETAIKMAKMGYVQKLINNRILWVKDK